MNHNCDICDGNTYTEDNPFVEIRTQRPSDPMDMCCIIWGHLNCFGGEEHIGDTSGTATPDKWSDWIEGEGAALGFAFLS